MTVENLRIIAGGSTREIAGNLMRIAGKLLRIAGSSPKETVGLSE